MKLPVGESFALRSICRTLTIMFACAAVSVSTQSCNKTDNAPNPATVAEEVVNFAQPLPEKKYAYLPPVQVKGLTIVPILDKATGTVISISRMEEKTGTALKNIMNRYEQDGLPVGEKDVLKFQIVDNFKMLIAGKPMIFVNGKLKDKGTPIMVSAVRSSPEYITNIYFMPGKKQKAVDMNAANDLCNRIVSFK